MMHLRLVLTGILITFLSGCKMVSLVPDYSATLEEQIYKTAKATDKIFIDMLDETADQRTYILFKQRYNDIEMEINSIALQNEARKKNDDFIVINKNLKSAFAEAKKYHKTQNVLNDGEIKSFQASLAAFWRPLYFAERSLKNTK